MVSILQSLNFTAKFCFHFHQVKIRRVSNSRLAPVRSKIFVNLDKAWCNFIFVLMMIISLFSSRGKNISELSSNQSY